jgi:hypothetical protein
MQRGWNLKNIEYRKTKPQRWSVWEESKGKALYEERKCICGCGNKFICKINRVKKFIHGHNSYLKEYSNREGLKRGIGWNRGLTKETNKSIFEGSIKSSISHKGQIPSNLKDLIKRNKNTEYTKERLSKLLKRRPISTFEQKILNLINHNNLPYKFVGNGNVWIGNSNPDFININGQKKVIEVYGSFQKSKNYGSSKNYEKLKRKHYKQYGFDVLFLNEKDILTQNWDKRCLSKISGGD